jgi:hypothetical protein
MAHLWRMEREMDRHKPSATILKTSGGYDRIINPALKNPRPLPPARRNFAVDHPSDFPQKIRSQLPLGRFEAVGYPAGHGERTL